MAETKQKVPYFMQGTETNLKAILSDGGLFADLDRAIYVFLKDTGELAYVEQNKTIHKIVGNCKKQVVRVSTLPPKGDPEVLYIFGKTVYTYDADDDAFYPSYKDLDMRVEDVEKALDDALRELKENSKDIVDIKDQLSKITFKELEGKIANPIIIADLESGIYGVRGMYKIANSSPTTYSTTATLLFFVMNEDGVTNIKKITSTDIVDYIVNDTEITTDSVVMKSYLDSLNFATVDYVDEKLSGISEKIAEEVVVVVEDKIDETVDERITENFDTCSSDDIKNLFS